MILFYVTENAFPIFDAEVRQFLHDALFAMGPHHDLKSIKPCLNSPSVFQQPVSLPGCLIMSRGSCRRVYLGRFALFALLDHAFATAFT